MARRDRTPELFPTEPDPEPAPEYRLFADVAVNRPMRCEYTYAVPDELESEVAPGVRVAVPLGPRREVGVVVGLSPTTDLAPEVIKPIHRVLDPEPVVDETLLELTAWMASYYACSWGEALAAVLPAALKREGGRRSVILVRPADGVGAAQLAEIEATQEKQHRLLRTLLDVGGPIERREVLRRLNLSPSPLSSLERRGWVVVERVAVAPDELALASTDRERPERLLEGQEQAVRRISEHLDAAEYQTVLLHGVTGSGKTEVYLRVIERALELDKGAIVLVPEIALTPQTVGWFRSRFGDVAVLHSRMTDVQRLDMWMRVKRGEARVVVGARSAIFAPVSNLGVIVVDEEHEPSFKQSNAPRYHARDLAVVRARNSSAVCILGTATPSLESWHNARIGRYERIQLDRRVHGGKMPTIEIVDMRQEPADAHGPVLFSRRLATRLRETLESGSQSILFLNRRGYSPVMWCRECGETVRCANCDVSLTYHRRIDRMVCHSCCDEIRLPVGCPTCTAPGPRLLGVGSEKVQDALARTLPSARVGRMDSDTMIRREDYEETLDAFGRGDLDVLVGTQMIAKGLDFPGVTLVGIVSADSSLHLPDFRAAERTFQLVSQVAGRAGRGELEGHIVVQTVTPEHPAIVQAARHDFETFARIESEAREELGYPPFGRVIRVVFDDVDLGRVTEACSRWADALRDALAGSACVVLGPAPAPISMVRGRHRMHLLLKSTDSTALARARSILVRLEGTTGRPRVAIDVDPVGML